MPKKPIWQNTARWKPWSQVPSRSYRCAYCGDKVSSSVGHILNFRINEGIPWTSADDLGGLVICPECSAPTFFYPNSSEVFPSPSLGNPVKHVPPEVNQLYEEARSCTASNNYTAAVLLCRKLLMHLAVAQGANTGENFMAYVNFLASAGYVPPNGRHWVDHIRKKGNEANHEIVLMAAADAKDLLSFSEMLLRFIYEFPNTIPLPSPPSLPTP